MIKIILEYCIQIIYDLYSKHDIHHGDVKLTNFVYSKDTGIKVIDFGSSRPVNKKPDTSQIPNDTLINK